MKKKRIVKLEPQTVELFAEVLSKLRPPPPLTVSQWADRYRVLSAESSAEPGRWHTEKAPYQRAIMDAIGDPHVRSVVVMSAAQIGKTKVQSLYGQIQPRKQSNPVCIRRWPDVLHDKER